jgi:diguanylate cyclase (GGDEF)-like protein
VLKDRTEQAEDASRRDVLTGVLNRTWLDRLLEQEFTEASVFGRDLSVVHIDLDRFRTINERFGNPVGDQLLRSCGQALQSCVRGSDLVARFSGEEFLLVLPGAEPAIARQVAERALAAITAISHDAADSPVRVTASIGVVSMTPKQRFPNSLALLEAVDHALYAAKLRGRNRVESFDDLSATARAPVLGAGSSKAAKL